MTALSRSIIVISDFVGRDGSAEPSDAAATSPVAREQLAVVGSYLERLPLAMIRSGWADFGEIWNYRHGSPASGGATAEPGRPGLSRRSFELPDDRAPFHSEEMLTFVQAHGAPAILCVWGLGVSEAILEACRDSFILYNSIDAPALRVPDAVARHFDLVLTAAAWQSEEIARRMPQLPTLILPIGPEFAAPEMFFPIPEAKKTHDVIYVAAAQPYKRHDILFEALRDAPRPLKALCVIGYGELGAELRQRAEAMQLDVDFVGPPGVPYDEVNRLMNAARIGVVCGVDDGAPAILTEYMLVGLPVLANSELRCGRDYIQPSTGLTAEPKSWGTTLADMLGRLEDFSPRQTVLDRWTWRSSIRQLEPFLRNRQRKPPLNRILLPEPAS